MREIILQETFKLFSEVGYDASLSEIATRVGLKKASLYNYFKKKEDLIKEVIDIEIEKRYASETSVFDNYSGNSCEMRLKVIYFSLLEYSKEMNTLNFWRQLRNVSDQSIKNYSISKIVCKDDRFTQEVNRIIEEGYMNGEIKYHDRIGVFNLYKTLTYGVLYFIRSYSDVEEFEAYTISVWHTYWNLIKT